MAQGMYAVVQLAGHQSNVPKKLTMTTEAITLAIYDNVSLLVPGERGYDICWKTFVNKMIASGHKSVTHEQFVSDFIDLVTAVQNVDKTTMLLPCGSKVVTYCKGEPAQDEAGFLEMSWEREEWWMQNPFIEPIVTSIHGYYPDFAPWKGHKEPLIAALLARSSLI